MRLVTLNPKGAISFDEAQTMAQREAGKILSEPMKLAWLNRETGYHSPDVDCCQADGKESWEIYAENRGGSLRVEVGSQFTFIFREGAV